MKAVLQRVSQSQVSVDDSVVNTIKNGLLIFLGVKKGDTEEHAKKLADRCLNVRIFEDSDNRFNLSVKDVQGEVLVVPQFTLLADTTHGRRPSFTSAEEPNKAERLYEYFLKTLNSMGIAAKGGAFGECMLVSLQNRGPVTIIMEE
ncbi:D-tyrosyl-tRNA(Tyr) deacylase [candidate division WOR_3 bacterium SM23_60]|uniref:D-aminoacyl-tRNA deacylase n=1 Tax=candidate division WOR_3 bacterium SM23_60 TaxID=1703780 RepID=A0A0S8GFC7_UNCW3|nr:MAG: D-tyrosyl-tRNA(Tyr) deacylase [candidate division WOR_3 bacterium SM23_60]